MTVNEFYCELPKALEDPTLGELGGIAATIPHQPAEAVQWEATAMAVLAYGSEFSEQESEDSDSYTQEEGEHAEVNMISMKRIKLSLNN